MTAARTVGTSVRPDLPLAVVVGAGGLGLAVARRVGERNRLLVADRDSDHLEHTAEQLRRGGHDVTTIACDVTDQHAVAALAETAAELGPVRTLAHVVGLSPSMGDWRQVMSVDLIGATLVESAMLEVAGAGTAAIFISSLAAHGVTPSAALTTLLDDPLTPGFLDRLETELGGDVNSGQAYGLAKWALNRRCQRQAAAWGARGARIVSLSPGLIATPMGAIEFQQQPAKYDILAQVPLDREGTMLEIADAVEFLASDRASYISGIDLLVDGGVAAAMRHRSST
jgi:NAD(P)-dependent dehydrogenase (short-subunit alcohol dehydrogenase family)